MKEINVIFEILSKAFLLNDTLDDIYTLLHVDVPVRYICYSQRMEGIANIICRRVHIRNLCLENEIN